MKDGFSVLTREGAFEQGLFYFSRRTKTTSSVAVAYRGHILLPPAIEVCEGYVFTGVCLSTGDCLPPSLGRHPPGQTPLRGQTHPHTPCPVHAGIHPPAQCRLEYGQQAGGMHPTGMHSCSIMWGVAECDWGAPA